jgi:hypothetical protein
LSGDGIADSACDCDGNVEDECGVCGGDNTSCSDCNGVPNGDSTLDCNNICDNDPSNDPDDFDNDGICDSIEIPGCMDIGCACNYQIYATINDGSCRYPQDENHNCDGLCITNIDCSGECGGSSEDDFCGICGGTNELDYCPCDTGYIDDCSGNGNCCPESWVGDGQCDQNGMACDLTCHDNDGGDCNTCEENNLITCPDDSCAETIENCPDADCEDIGGDNTWIADGWCDSINNNEICNYDGGDCCPCTCENAMYSCNQYGGTCYDCIVDGDSSITCPEDCIEFCGDGICNSNETSITCPEDCIEFCGDGICNSNETSITCPEDCIEFCGDGICNSNETSLTCPGDCQGDCNAAPGDCGAGYVSDCADSDCCHEEWIGDGSADCEDQAWGCDLTCYDNDGGDCGEYEGGCADLATFDPCAAAVWDAK